MKKYILFIGIAVIGSVLFSISCKHDPLPYIKKVCFSDDVLPLITNNCAMSGCHSGTGERGALNSYSSIVSQVNPGNSGSSRLYNAITGNGENAMPPNKPLTQDQKNIIKWWIDQGAENTTDCNAGNCDTANVTYSGIVQPLISSNCGGCHGPGASMGITLTVYNDLKQYLDANKQKFVDAINYTSAKVMPPSGKMSACKISQMQKWINAGYAGN
ncbi:MAG: c-type cytochrome [Bacteroidota bacterium]